MLTIEQVDARLREVAQTQASHTVDIEMYRREIRALTDRIAALENRAGMGGQLAPAPYVGPLGPGTTTPTAPAAPALRGWEAPPVSLVAMGFSPDKYALRPEKYAGEPPAERLVSKGDAAPTSYLYDPAQPFWVNSQRWDNAGRPSRDANGQPLDVRGYPMAGQPDFGPR